MKLKDIIILGIIFILIILLFVFTQKKAVSSVEFVNIAEKYHLKTFNMTKQLDSIDSIQEAIFAESEDHWQIEYYVFNSTKDAIQWFHYNQKEQNSKYTNPKFFDEHHHKNTNDYTIITYQSYIHVSQIKNTLVFANVPIEYMNDVNKILNKIKY